MASNLDVDALSADLPRTDSAVQIQTLDDRKTAGKGEHVEHVRPTAIDFTYDGIDHKPKLRARTWIALASMVLFNLVCTTAVLTPTSVVSKRNLLSTLH